MSDRYADLRAALENAERGLNVAFDGRHSFFKKEIIRALLAERDKYASVLEGLPQDAIDGGWTAKGISAYAKQLEAERDRLREAMKTIAGFPISSPLNMDAWNMQIIASAALAQERGGCDD